MPRPLRWIQTDGGPSIAVPYEMRDLWEGSDPPNAGRIVRLKDNAERKEPATDYDSACEAARFVGLVRRNEFVALAIARGPITWLSQSSGGVLVHWEYGDSPKEVDTMLRAALTPAPGRGAAEILAWTPTGLRLPVPSGKLIIFDAACRARGRPAAMRLLVTVAPGTHAIDEANFEPNDSTFMTLYRFSPPPHGPRGS